MFDDLVRVRTGVHTYRESSWDRSGRNRDYIDLRPGESATLLEAEGPGRIAHFYWGTINASRFHFRQFVLRAWWDGEPTPSVEVPLGDLFLIPHCTPVDVRSLGAVVNPGSTNLLTFGASLYLPMPFAESARVELAYDPIPGHPAGVVDFWYHINLERYDRPLAPEAGRFHAQWRRENPTTPKAGTDFNDPLWNGDNIGGQANYVALEAEGAGHLAGIHLQVDNLGGGWYGEGDDMIWVDGPAGEGGERSGTWPPTYHGTGSEEVFGGGGCPNVAYHGPYTGFHLIENMDYSGKSGMYRWYLADPIRFERSLVWTIEHGHDNNYCNDYASVAYWYQIEPHARFPALLEVSKRLPRFPEAIWRGDAALVESRARLNEALSAGRQPAEMRRMWDTWARGARALKQERFEEAIATFETVR